MAHRLHRYGHWTGRWLMTSTSGPLDLWSFGFQRVNAFLPTSVHGFSDGLVGLVWGDHSCLFHLVFQCWIDGGTWWNVAIADQLWVFSWSWIQEGGVHLQPRALGEGWGKVCHVQVLHDTLGWNVFKVLGSHGHPRKVASGKRPWSVMGSSPVSANQISLLPL